MKPTTMVMGFTGMAMAFAGGIVALPALVFVLAAAAGPVFVFGTAAGVLWLARPRVRPKARPLRQAIAAGSLPGVLAMPANNIRRRG